MNKPLGLLVVPDSAGRTYYIPVDEITGIVDLGDKPDGDDRTLVRLRGNRDDIHSPRSALMLVRAYVDLLGGKPTYKLESDL